MNKKIICYFFKILFKKSDNTKSKILLSLNSLFCITSFLKIIL